MRRLCFFAARLLLPASGFAAGADKPAPAAFELAESNTSHTGMPVANCRSRR